MRHEIYVCCLIYGVRWYYVRMIKNSLPSHIFRGYDIRGIADTELTDENVRLIIKAYATFLYQRQIRDVVVGHDARLTSPRIHKVVIDQLVDCGFRVKNIGLALTPTTYWAQYHYLAKGAVMITASHNPKEYNGFKLALGFSDTLITDELQWLKAIAQSEDFSCYQESGSLVTEDIFPLYKTDILSKVYNKKSLKIVVDACNGTAGKFLPDLLRTAGHTVIEQNCNLDGNFPLGDPDPTVQSVLNRLGNSVVAENADIGFAFDCDGDRLGIVDETGKPIWNDNLISIFALDILDYLPGSSIVFNTLCSKQVSDVISFSGGKPVMWMTGHSFIKAKVKELRAPFGGELSGHFFFMDNFYGHDDGAFASLRLLSYLERHEETLSPVLASLPFYFSSPQIKLGCSDDIKFSLISSEITADIKQLFGSDAKYIDIDGIRADLDDRMAIIRASQNGPYITVKFEAKTTQAYEELKNSLNAILRKYDNIDYTSGGNVEALA